MKHLKKIALIVLAAALCVCVIAFVGCGKGYNGTYNGEYHYTQYGTDYGVKVEVEVENNVIKSVKVIPSNYTNASDARNDWTPEKWTDHEAEALAKFVGKTVDEIKAIVVERDEAGAPKTGVTYDGLVITGATMSSGRLILAIQDALK